MAEQRKSLVEEIKSGEHSLSELCRKHGISRPTAYKWLGRSGRCESMESRSRAPLSIPNKTSPSVESVILEARSQHPCWGGRKLKAYLERSGEIGIPSAKTVTAILSRNGLISEEASRAAKHYRRFEMARPNDLWQADFKGHFAMEDGNRCFPLTVTDDMSRFSLCISAKGNERLEGVKDSFLSLFREYGLPKVVLSDNGNPWGSNFAGGHTKFEVFLMDYGVLPIHGRPLHPQTQGKAERFNKTLKHELLAQTSIMDLRHAQKEFDAFRKTYNEERPHCSLNFEVPLDKYRNSERVMPEKVREWEYPEGSTVRKVGIDGYAYFKGPFFLSNAFHGCDIALAKTETEDFMDIIYRNFKVATLNIKERILTSKKISKLKQKV